MTTHPKFTIDTDPTYTLPVLIPRQGLPDAELVVTYKARSPEEMLALDKKIRKDKPDDVTLVLDIASGWELEEPFTAEVIKTVQAKQPGFVAAVVKKYYAEYDRVRLGNLLTP